jgi:hypothetical protein
MSREQDVIGAALESIAPNPDVRLVGFGLMAEWQQPDGQRLLTRLLGDGGNPWQVKGYFHDGLNGGWPADNVQGEHHNPGHPSGWMVID